MTYLDSSSGPRSPMQSNPFARISFSHFHSDVDSIGHQLRMNKLDHMADPTTALFGSQLITSAVNSQEVRDFAHYIQNRPGECPIYSPQTTILSPSPQPLQGLRQALPCASRRPQRINPLGMIKFIQQSAPLRHDHSKYGRARE